MQFGAPWNFFGGYRGQFQGAVGASILSVIKAIELEMIIEQMDQRNHFDQFVTQNKIVSVIKVTFVNNQYQDQNSAWFNEKLSRVSSARMFLPQVENTTQNSGGSFESSSFDRCCRCFDPSSKEGFKVKQTF